MKFVAYFNYSSTFAMKMNKPHFYEILMKFSKFHFRFTSQSAGVIYLYRNILFVIQYFHGIYFLCYRNIGKFSKKILNFNFFYDRCREYIFNLRSM